MLALSLNSIIIKNIIVLSHFTRVLSVHVLLLIIYIIALFVTELY